MIKRLTKHGNSYALIIEKPILELLNIKPDTPLDISTDGNVLVVGPAKNEKRVNAFNSALKKTNKQYGKMLAKLAK